MAILFFLYFALVIILSGILTITFKSVVHSAISLLVTFVHIAGIYILLNAEFLAAVQLIVYSGAILVLYLFVVMLFNISTTKDSFQKQMPVGFFIASIILIELMMVLNNGWFAKPTGEYTTAKLAEIGNTEAIGSLLYTKYLYPFEVASIILLVALIGSIFLAGNVKATKTRN